MGLEIVEPNACIRGCCSSNSIPLHLPPSSYTLLKPIARGAESVVYEAILDGKKVAVKKPILSTSEDLDKFHKELQLLCKFDHPGIAKLVAAHAKPPNYMYFFEFFEPPNLSEKLHMEEWSPNINQVLVVAVQLAKALQYLHHLGIVHRDVKPANILLDKYLYPHLADFGLAEYKKDLKGVSIGNWRSSGKPTGGFHKKNMVGTLIYMAPEILNKEIHTEKSDVYSFGISIKMYQMQVEQLPNFQLERSRIPGFLQALRSTSSPSGALFEAFIKTDIAFRAELDFSRKSKRVIPKDWHPGCTAAAALIVGNKRFVANAGDCRTILCRAGHPFVLSKDHVASCLEERERVISAGEQVRWQVDNWRVGLAALQVASWQ
ncbi:protein kinase and PP2C-like domain-containing protein isoform X2 [Prunus avium]|uniref:Protein kinase and PP2C-like domain-containing protein isoform X2 n=1 Tax=Prunus avium TaxID=42229 RepID=A0A6P5RPS2_PRUAV|nr:protein kinase and PP2C-like domain-containing protein isoform X2 [Prunus avium]